MKYKLHTTTNPYLDLVRQHKKPYTTRVLGKEIIVHPNVMSPKYDWSPRFHIENMPVQKDRTWLEVGCGSGILSIFAAIQGATNLTAIDINPHAIENTKANLEKYNIKNTNVHLSDLFEKVSGKFDTINFAAPYHGNKPQDILEHGVSDGGYKTLRRFMKEAKLHLNEGGQIILGFSNTGDVNLLNQLIIENKYLVKDFHEEENDGWKAYLYILEVIDFKYPLQKFIYEDDYLWFKKYRNEVSKGKILKVGYGLGYASYFIKLYNKQITNLDVKANKHAILPEDITLYDGDRIPYNSDEFDTVLCNYTLHHINNPKQVFKEIVRVSSKNIVIVEETYQTLLQKIDLVLNCWKTNSKVGQKVHIHWSNYFSSQSLLQLFEERKLAVKLHETVSRKTFLVDLFILTKN